MRTKTLGRTGLDVSIVGLGAAFLGFAHPNSAVEFYTGKAGADTKNAVDEKLGVQTVHTAIEAGCTLIDTAPLYGDTQSERIIGQALKERLDLAEKCTVTTKVGQVKGHREFTFDAILRDVEASRDRLGIDEFDVLYIHDAMEFPLEEVMADHGALGALRKLQKEGVVRFIGSAMNDPATNALYIVTGEFDAAVVPEAWSLLNLLADDHIFPAAEKYNVGLVIATPLERGLLATGPVSEIDYLARNFSQACLDHVTRIQSLCRDHNIPLPAASLQWCTRHPQIAATIPGARTPDEALQNAQAGDVDIPDAFWEDLEPLVQHWEAGKDR